LAPPQPVTTLPVHTEEESIGRQGRAPVSPAHPHGQHPPATSPVSPTEQEAPTASPPPAPPPSKFDPKRI
jgi:hypothetical protein